MLKDVQASQRTLVAVAVALFGATGITSASPPRGWPISTVASGNNGASSLEFAPDGQPALSYVAFPLRELRYAKFDGTSWPELVIPTPGVDLGGATSLAFAPDGSPAICFYDDDEGDLYLARFAEGEGFTVEILAEPENPGCLAFNPAGMPAIAYGRDEPNGAVVYSVFEDGAWTHSEVGGEGANEVSLAFTPQGEPALAYYDANNHAIMFAVRSAGGWELSNVESVGEPVREMRGSVSLAFTPSGEAAIAYLDATAGRVRYAVREGSSDQWAITTIADEVEILFTFTLLEGRPALAFTGSGQPAVAYFDADPPSIHYATRCEGVWTDITVDSVLGTNLQLGRVDLAITPQGHPALSYSNGRLKGVSYTVGGGLGAEIKRVCRVGDRLRIDFTGPPRVSEWRLMGSPDLQSYSDDLTAAAGIIESAPGEYVAEFDVAGKADLYFVRVEWESKW